MATNLSWAKIAAKGTPSALNAPPQSRNIQASNATPSKIGATKYEDDFPQMGGTQSVASNQKLMPQKSETVVSTAPSVAVPLKQTAVEPPKVIEQKPQQPIASPVAAQPNTNQNEQKQTPQTNQAIKKETDRQQQQQPQQRQISVGDQASGNQQAVNGKDRTASFNNDASDNGFVENKPRHRKRSENQDQEQESGGHSGFRKSYNQRNNNYRDRNNNNRRSNEHYDNRGRNAGNQDLNRQHSGDDHNTRPRFDFAAKKAEEENHLNERFKDQKDKLCFDEITGDLFSANENVSLAHCVSVDLEMGKGIAVEFKTRFGRVEELEKHYPKVGKCLFLNDKQRYVFYLITKPRYFHKPTYRSLEDSLKHMRNLCEKFKVAEVAMPRIGCGLDLLEWNYVSRIVDDVFANTNTKVTIYTQDN